MMATAITNKGIQIPTIKMIKVKATTISTAATRTSIAKATSRVAVTGTMMNRELKKGP
jgi:hypothetical protein